MAPDLVPLGMGDVQAGRGLGRTPTAAVRRRSAVAAAAATALVLAAGLVTLAVLLPAPTVAGRPTSDTDRAEVYLTLLGNTSGRVFIVDHSCGDVGKGPSFDCSGPAIPAGVQARIRGALGPAVRFGSMPPSGMQPDLRSMIVAFGPLTIAGDRARLGMAVHCGPLCGNGATYLLARSDGVWRITGQTGRQWIS